MSAPNLNALWAKVLLGALYRSGVRDVCITPGSRSTPLTVATHLHAGLHPHVHLDERAAAFFALGLAKATHRPVALICTSGTAAANYLPAVVEASLSNVPLILLTADRPLALRGSGASQTIDQVHLFGHHVRHFAEIQLPEAEETALRRLEASCVQAFGLAAIAPQGPVHLNVQFADPLAPLPLDQEVIASLERALPTFATSLSLGQLRAEDPAIGALAAQIARTERGLIVAGPDANAAGIVELARRSGFPLLADVASGVRFREMPAGVRCAHADAFLRSETCQDWRPDLVIRVGGLPTSAPLNAALARWMPWTVMLQGDLLRRDPEALVKLTVVGNVPDSLARLVGLLPDEAKTTAWQRRFQDADEVCERTFQTSKNRPVEAYSVRAALEVMPADCAVFLSSSMPIRYAETLASALKPGMRVFVNRGANGIDGITSTALGLCVGAQLPTLLITGDLAFLHDLGGLMGVRHVRHPFTILAVNNDGGAIFSHLPISQFPEVFEPYFGTPHGLAFSPAADMFGLAHHLADSPEHVASLLEASLQSNQPSLIEVRTVRTAEADAYKALMHAVVTAVDEAFAGVSP